MSRYNYRYHYQLESYRSIYTQSNQNNLTCDLELIHRRKNDDSCTFYHNAL